MPVPRRRWVEMTTAEFSALPPDTVAVLRVAAIEQHGPHLPVDVDACLNEGVVARAIRSKVSIADIDHSRKSIPC